MSPANDDGPLLEVHFESVDSPLDARASARVGDVTKLDGSGRGIGARETGATCDLASNDVEIVEEEQIRDPLLGSVIAERYKVLARIGSGGIGHVYKVEHTQIGKLCAMKLLARSRLLDATMEWRFRREALAISKLESPNTVQVFDFGVSGGTSYLVMELVRGETLGALLGRLGPLSPTRVLKIAIQICTSLEEAHAAGIIHRDIKPDNVMIVRALEGADVVKVVDFGLAKLDVPEEAGKEVTSRGMVLGTPHYMAPEQIVGDEIDARADLYALGGLMYRVLSGCFPFDGRPVDVLRKSLVESPVPLRDRDPTGRVPGAVSAIVEKCLARSPADRFGSARALKEALVAALRDITSASSVKRLLDPRWVATAARSSAAPIATRDDVDSYERRLRTRRTGVKALLGVAAVGAAVAGGGWAYQSRASTAETTEQEPNDDADDATRIAVGQPVRAHIGRRIDREHGDRDHFVFDLAGDASLKIEVSPLPNMPLCAVLYRAGLLEPIGHGCAATDAAVSFQTVPLTEGRYFVVVRQDTSAESHRGGAHVVENVSDEYTIAVQN